MAPGAAGVLPRKSALLQLVPSAILGLPGQKAATKGRPNAPTCQADKAVSFPHRPSFWSFVRREARGLRCRRGAVKVR